MDTRNVQKTSDMLYLYLPTRWCKKFNINGKSKVGIKYNNDNSLGVYPEATNPKKIHLKLRAKGDNLDNLQKLIIAAFISHADSFRITLDNEVDFSKILSQKSLVSLELVEMEGKHITCESSIEVSDPLSLIATMIRKTRNLVLIMSKNAPREILDRYEEEIDRSDLLIEKSVIASLVNPTKSTHQAVELHFLSKLSKELEHFVDHLINLKVNNQEFLKQINLALTSIQNLLDDNGKNLTYNNTMFFIEIVDNLPNIKLKNVEDYNQHRAIRSLHNISEILIDWAVIKETKTQTT